MKSVLITGASGFVGGFLVDEALSRGFKVYAAIRKSSNTQYLQDSRIHFLYPNFSNVEELTQLVDEYQFDYFIHNAGVTKSKTEQGYFDVNAGFLKNIVQALQLARHKVSKLIFVSSLAAFGPAEYTESGVVSNDSIPHPVTNYGRSKLKAESYLTSQSNVPYIIIRPTAVYGPREWDLFTVYKMINQGLNITIGMKDQLLTFIYVKDLVRVIMDATESEISNKAYFVSDYNVYTSSEYNAQIAKALSKKKTLKFRLPISIVKVVAIISENIAKISGKYPPLNLEKVNELKAKSWKIDTSPLQTDLNFIPEYDLEKGLEESIDWYKQKGHL